MDEARLAKIPLFASLSKLDRASIARVTDEVDVEEGRHIIDQGECAYEFFVIGDGSAEAYIDGRHVADLGPGDFFGEMAALDHSNRRGSVIATSPMTLFVMTDYDFRHIQDAMPVVAERIRESIAERMSLLSG